MAKASILIFNAHCPPTITKQDATTVTTQFLTLDQPLFPQIWNGNFSKAFYLEQVHRPHFYKGSGSAPLFGNFLEPLTKTYWWIVPLLWLPFVIYGTSIAATRLDSWVELTAYWFGGFVIWSLIEYCMHRFLFHIDTQVSPSTFKRQ